MSIERLKPFTAEERKRFRAAPCFLCGYNSHDYYQPATHPCARRYHATDAAYILALEDRLREVERRAKEVIRPFALLVERQDASDLAFLKEQGGGEKDMVHYAPDSAKVHSSGELRGALYLTKGDFRELAKFYRVLSEREGQDG